LWQEFGVFFRQSFSRVKPVAATTSDAGTRRDFLYVASGAMGAVGVAAVAWPLIDQMNPSAAALALGTSEIDIASIQPGQQIVFKHRGLPLFVRRRTPAGVQFTEVKVEPALLQLKGRATDPQAFARINALPLGLQASPLFQPQGVQLVKANREDAPSGAGTGSGAGASWRQPVVFELTAAFADRPALLDGDQLRALGADGMAQRLLLLQRAGVLP
jgi:hypothetical protein